MCRCYLGAIFLPLSLYTRGPQGQETSPVLALLDSQFPPGARSQALPGQGSSLPLHNPSTVQLLYALRSWELSSSGTRSSHSLGLDRNYPILGHVPANSGLHVESSPRKLELPKNCPILKQVAVSSGLHIEFPAQPRTGWDLPQNGKVVSQPWFVQEGRAEWEHPCTRLLLLAESLLPRGSMYSHAPR